jgi:hypothetical protein
MKLRKYGLGLAVIAGILGSTVNAQSRPQLTQAMFVEQINDDGATRAVKRADQLSKGDRVILLVKWNSNSSDTSFTVSSAVPQSLAYERSSLRTQTVSVDGGRNWGYIGELAVQDRYGKRLASVEDVTHLRWQVPAQAAAQGRGTITYSAIVR